MKRLANSIPFTRAATGSHGFTIVELLIVIVVLAILAVLTIVAYNGVQQRADNSAIIAGVDRCQKAFKLYNVDNGNYPTDTGCLGSNYPSDQCWTGPGGTFSVSSTLDAALAPYISPKPVIGTKSLQVTTAPDYRMGALYKYSATSPKIVYMLEGANQTCIDGSSGTTLRQATQCTFHSRSAVDGYARFSSAWTAAREWSRDLRCDHSNLVQSR